MEEEESTTAGKGTEEVNFLIPFPRARNMSTPVVTAAPTPV